MALALSIVGGAAVYANELKGCAEVYVGARFYFLTAADKHVAVGAMGAYLDGGAGYVMEKSGREYAVYACYFSLSEGERAQNNLHNKGKKTNILCLPYENLYFKTAEEKREQDFIIGGLHALYACIGALGKAASALEDGRCTQESAKAELKAHATVLHGLQRTGIFSATLLQEAEETLKESGDNIVFAKDVRYAQLLLCDAYCGAADQLSL